MLMFTCTRVATGQEVVRANNFQCQVKGKSKGSFIWSLGNILKRHQGKFLIYVFTVPCFKWTLLFFSYFLWLIKQHVLQNWFIALGVTDVLIKLLVSWLRCLKLRKNVEGTVIISVFSVAKWISGHSLNILFPCFSVFFFSI